MSKRKKNKRRLKKNKRRKREAMQEFLIEFNDIIDDIVDKLKNPKDDSPEGFIIKYEINNMRYLAQFLTRKLPLIPPTIEDKDNRVQESEGDIFLLWHGTSLHRANSILKSGFKSGRFKRDIYFASNIMTSLSYAIARASTENSEPAIFAAICNPNKLWYGENFQPQTYYTFRDAIATQLVKYLLTCHGLYSIGEIATKVNDFKNEFTEFIVTEVKRFKDDLTDIAITQNAGNTGIAYWLNSFLGLDDSECIAEHHPAVGQIKACIDKQYESGRIATIADEEILILAKKHLPEYFQKYV